MEAAGQFTLLAGLYKNTFPLKSWEERLRVKPGMGLQRTVCSGLSWEQAAARSGGRGRFRSRLRCRSVKAFFLEFFKCYLVLGKFLDWDRLQEIRSKNILCHKGQPNIGVLLAVPWLLLMWSGSEVHCCWPGRERFTSTEWWEGGQTSEQCIF